MPGYPLALQTVEVFDINRGQVAEQHHQNGQADARLGGCHDEDEKYEELARKVVEVVREGDEIDIHRQQHQFDGHQEHDQVLPVEEDADDADGASDSWP